MSRCAMAVLLALVLLGCTEPIAAPPGQAPGAAPFERLSETAFSEHSAVPGNRVFDLVAADVDLDRDPDLLINWHHLGRMELYENRDDSFVMINPLDADTSGIYDNRDVPSLFADVETMRTRLASRERPGLYLWHDTDRRGHWRLAWIGDPEGAPDLVLKIEASLPIVEADSTETLRFERLSPESLSVSLRRASTRGFLSFRTDQATVGVLLSLDAGTQPQPTIYLGRDLTPFENGRCEAWKPDPHGMAWVDVQGDPRPELYITRGALIGQLEAPRSAKQDRFFLPAPEGGSLYRRSAQAIVPRDRERGRRVEWVDATDDGLLDMSVSNESTPNRLLVRREPEGSFSDRASALGLDVEETVTTWADHDGDGRDDVYILSARTIDVLHNSGDGAFERLSGREIGLVLPDSFVHAETQFDFGALRLADVDRDGDLDLWLLSAGRDQTNHLFRRNDDGFEDIGVGMGLDSIAGNIFATLLDIDNDGLMDAVSSGRLIGETQLAEPDGHLVLWRNRTGRRFVFERLAREVAPHPVHAAAAIDFDGDGATDLALVGTRRSLLRNTLGSASDQVTIVPVDTNRHPLGALVRVVYSDGSILAQRWGSAHGSAFSQTLLPLRFGIPPGAEIEAVRIHWPGTAEEISYPPPDRARSTQIRR